MATDAKKHSTIAAGEKPTRAAIAAGLLSINDIIPVSGGTEANQVAAAVAALGQNLATNPVFVSRADARGLHRVEYTYDGTTWLPASGVLSFASKGAADTWASANSTLLTFGDTAQLSNATLEWNGTKWIGGAPVAPTFTGIYSSSGSVPVQVSIVGQRAYVKGVVVTGGGVNFVLGTAYTLGAAGAIPAGFRPAETRTFACSANATALAAVSFLADGSITMVLNTTFTGALALDLSTASWIAV